MSVKNIKDKEVKLNKEFSLSDDFPVPTYDDWKSSVEKLLKGQSFEKKLLTKTYEGIELNPIYLGKDIENLFFINSEPGKDNLLRGTKSDGYLNEGWQICQDIKCGSLKEFNIRLKATLKNGQTAIALNLNAFGIKNLERFSEALDGIDLEKYPIYLKNGVNSNFTLNLLLDYVADRGYEPGKIKGFIESDPAGFLAENGNLPDPLERIYEDMGKSIRLASDKLPKLRILGINGSLYHNAGADSVAEMSIALATAVEYLDAMVSRGIDINIAAKQIYFTVGIGTNFFMEIGKLRSLRVLWQKIVKEFGGGSEAQKVHIHAKTSFFYQTKLDPFVNTLRTTTEAFSAIIGGADAITTNPYDDTLGENSELSMRIARNTQIILKEESNLKKLIDPAGGSYYVESLTAEIIKKVWAEFQHIEKEEGIINSLKSGYIQDKLEDSLSLRKKDIFKRKSVIVGTNMFVNAEDTVPNIEKKKGKDIEADKDGLTVRKISPLRISEPFEEMRKSVFDYFNKTGKKPVAFLCNFGTLKQYKGRADFSRGYFEVGGFEIVYPEGFTDTEKAASAAASSNAEVVVLCSDDPSYSEIVEKITSSLKNLNKNVSVILAGFPGEDEELYRQQGVDDFIYMGSNLYATLDPLLKKSGVK